jgi:hypothetical protein
VRARNLLVQALHLLDKLQVLLRFPFAGGHLRGV